MRRTVGGKPEPHRFPVQMAAKIATLAKVYPNRTRTELVRILLANAIDNLEPPFPQTDHGKPSKAARTLQALAYTKERGWPWTPEAELMLRLLAEQLIAGTY